MELARQYKVDAILKPLLEYQETAQRPLKMAPSKGAKKNVTNTFQQQGPAEKRMKMDHIQYQQQIIHPAPTQHMGNEYFDYRDQSKEYNTNPYMNYYQNEMYHAPPPLPPQHQPHPQNLTQPAEQHQSERHRAAIMSLFLDTTSSVNQELLYPHTILPADFDIDLILDDQGHTATHWASALANISLLTLAIQKGSQIDRLNFIGESALIRAVMVVHNHERQSFYDLLSILKDTITITDKKKRTVLHHICLTSSIKARSPVSVYYMDCLLSFIEKAKRDDTLSSELMHADNQNSLANRFSSLLNQTDICGDTALNIAARLGNRQLFEKLYEAGADPFIYNNIGLKPSDYGFDSSVPAQYVSLMTNDCNQWMTCHKLAETMATNWI